MSARKRACSPDTTFDILANPRDIGAIERPSRPALLDVVVPVQRASQWCWAAVVTALVRFNDPARRVWQCALASLASRNPGACTNSRESNNTSRVVNILVALGYPAKEGGPLQASDVGEWIKQQVPLPILLWMHGAYSHYTLITGFVDAGRGWVVLQDPSPIGGVSQQMHGAITDWNTTTTLEFL